MKPILSDTQLEKTGTFIFQHGRLLERQLFAYLFQDGTKEACIKALLAYQNADGGFGNGIEPDLLCPDSSAIGAETAMVVLDVLGMHAGEVVSGLVDWIAANLNDAGFIDHPQPDMLRYPHQSWWANPDDLRILALAGFLAKWGVDAPDLFARVQRYYQTLDLPDKWNAFNYPFYVYLKYCRQESEGDQWTDGLSRLPALLVEHADHYPLFTRYWGHAAEDLAEDIVHEQARAFARGLREDGAIESPYPDLPWWDPIFTLDGLMVMKQLSLI
jgi:hypothetical protein